MSIRHTPRVELPHSMEMEGVARDAGDRGQEYLLELRWGRECESDIHVPVRVVRTVRL